MWCVEVMRFLPCKPEWQTESTCNSVGGFHSFSPCRRRRLCSVRGRLSSCWTSTPQSVALQTSTVIIWRFDFPSVLRESTISLAKRTFILVRWFDDFFSKPVDAAIFLTRACHIEAWRISRFFKKEQDEFYNTTATAWRCSTWLYRTNCDSQKKQKQLHSSGSQKVGGWVGWGVGHVRGRSNANYYYFLNQPQLKKEL